MGHLDSYNIKSLSWKGLVYWVLLSGVFQQSVMTVSLQYLGVFAHKADKTHGVFTQNDHQKHVTMRCFTWPSRGISGNSKLPRKKIATSKVEILDRASPGKKRGACASTKTFTLWWSNIAMEYHHFQQEIHLQMVHFPASYVSLPEGMWNLWLVCLAVCLYVRMYVYLYILYICKLVYLY